MLNITKNLHRHLDFTLLIPMYYPIRISLISNFKFFQKIVKIPKVPITCKIHSRSESKSLFSFYSYNNLPFLEFLKCVRIRSRSIVLTRSFTNGLRRREVSLSVVISDISRVYAFH